MPTPVLTPQRRLSWAREDAALSQEQLAEMLGVSTRTVRNWEGGEWMPPTAVVAWARACDVEYEWLIGVAPTPSVPTKLERRRHAKRTKITLEQPVPVSRCSVDDHEQPNRIHTDPALLTAA
jgi:transcriptional regulator with XRE-family HTH domain